MAQIETEKTTAYRLEQWGLWANYFPDVRYARCVFRAPGVMKAAPAPDITDDEALLIDGLLARLEQKDSVMGQVTIYFYRHGCSITDTAERFKLNRKRVDVLVGSGTAWMDAALEMKRAA